MVRGISGHNGIDDTKMIRGAQNCYRLQKRWAISGASLPGGTADEIVEATNALRRFPKLAVGRAGDLRECDFRVWSDSAGTHVQIELPGVPDDTMCERLRELMDVTDNPRYMG